MSMADDYDAYEKEDFYKKECDRCGTQDLLWVWTKEGWRLSYDPHGIHLHKCIDYVNLFESIED